MFYLFVFVFLACVVGTNQKLVFVCAWQRAGRGRGGMRMGRNPGGLMVDVVKRNAFNTAKALVEASVPTLIKVGFFWV